MRYKIIAQKHILIEGTENEYKKMGLQKPNSIVENRQKLSIIDDIDVLANTVACLKCGLIDCICMEEEC